MARDDAADALAAVLAERLPLSGLVLVPRSRRPRVLRHEGPTDDHALDTFAELGRDYLAADTSAAPYLDGTVWGFTVRERDGSPAAALFAIRRGGMPWTTTEQAFLNHAFLLVQDDLLAVAGRPRPDHAAGSAFDLEARLRAAVDQDELVLVYQPEVDLRSGRILAVEALLRWDHPELGRLGPQSFIPLAERSDLINLLGSWVIDHALAEFAAWRTEDLVLRINVSPAQLAEGGVVEHFQRALATHGVPGSRVCVEFTETASQTDVLTLAGAVPALAALGISTALDDLAAGYSTLGRLRSLPVDVVKLDRSLVVGIDVDQRAQAIVAALLKLAGELDVDVVAEGIENAAEAHMLTGLGCVRGQGHYFGRPQEGPHTAELVGSAASMSGRG